MKKYGMHYVSIIFRLGQSSIGLILLAISAGCVTVPTPTLTPSQTLTDVALSASIQITTSLTPCPFNWAYHVAPEETSSLQDSFEKAGFTNASVSAEAYGETGGPRCDFHVMSYDIFLSINDPTVKDEEALGQITYKALQMLRGTGKLQVAINGDGIGFQGNYFYAQMESLVDKNVTGSSLIEALKKLPNIQN